MTIGAQSFAFIRSLIALSRHRAGANQFGVRLGDIRALAKKIGPSHELALSLWETDNIDARLLATLLIKPKSLSAEEMNRMVRSVTFVQVADWLNAYVVKQHPGKETLRQKWMMTNHRWAARADPVVQRTMNGSLAAIGIHFPKLRKRAVTIGEKLGIYRHYPVSKRCTSPFASIWIEAMVKRQP